VLFDAAPEVRGFPFRACLRTAAAALALVLAPLCANAVAAELELRGGEAPPPLVLDALDGARTDLLTFHDRIVLVHFFATWCEPCVTEIAALNRLVDRTGGARPTVLAVNVGEIDARVRTFTRDNPVRFTILMDRDRSAMKAWGVEGLPTTFVLDRDLGVRLAATGDVDWDRHDVNRKLEELANTSKPQPDQPAASN